MPDHHNPEPHPLQHLALRVEEASLNAWPALHQQLYDGWLLRFSRGFTKRANSVNPLYTLHGWANASNQHPTLELLEKVRYCENLYAREDQPTVFRLTSLHASAGLHDGAGLLESVLDKRGYTTGGLSLVLVAPVIGPLGPSATNATQSGPTVTTKIVPALDEWLDAYCRIAAVPALARTLHQAILRGIHGELAFAQRSAAGAPVACGLGVLEAELLGLFDIITDPAGRRQGHAHALVLDLMHWAAANQARHAYLQVAADNAAALALYAQLGFTELYRYWYRSSP